ncbi:hypothetical protein CHGG_00802 [Chaetomium globosum CBS 148.51]|uniref:Mediator of RNA polymerase II transcription subunit 16 n=1 Tax=Chaetomium globosum (strain ATCC 6205 / CBS 148.51 / DSM 1962 / NBRC 6347 / NRRL 1970) TaxID=306901 RepID=Q2HG52_CHAGB|nr:uncharacterized protein CHGG_00802 [Chaetomium globosum CBS 148.51]EAQ92567.1 hypothetical protein CHGG_00802 [Chaetomium globosum CBS 148.51]
MALLLEGDSMNVDGTMQGLEGIEGMQGIQGMEGMEGMGGMEGMEGMEGLGSMGSAMALEEVDLFGDPVMDDALAGLPPRPLVSKSLLQRLDDLRVRGCCQGIAWSRQGTIATIAKDAMSVELRFIRSHPRYHRMGPQRAKFMLRIVRVGIQWGLPQVDKQVLSQSQPLRPSLRESHVAVTSWVQYGSSESAVDASVSRLSHIEILPSAHTAQSQPMHPPVVLTVRSYVPQDASSYQQESQSIIDRWEVLSDQPQALVPAFEQLGSKNGNTSALPTLTHLRKLEPIILPKVVVAVTTTQFGRVLCFAFSDGTVQYRNRFTMDEIYNELNTDSIMHPLQVGFHFVNDTPCLQVAFSPTNCSFVQIGEDSAIKWNRLHHPMENSETEFKNAIARPFAQFPDFASSWVKETVNMLKIVVDYSENTHHEQLVKNVPLQHCLSVINHLGFHGDFRPRSHGGKFAMLALSVKGAFLVITVASNSPIGTKEKLIPLDDPDVVDAVTGCTAWGISLLAWLSDSLFELLDDPEITAMLSGPKRFPELAKYLESKNNVALQLLLCSSTRGFLLALCRRLQHIETVSNRAAQYYETRFQQQQDPASGGAAPARPHPALSRAYQRMERVISSALVKVSEFERLLSDLGSDIQRYHNLLELKGQPPRPLAARKASQQPGGSGVPPPFAGNSSSSGGSGGSGMLPAGDNGMASYRMTIVGTWTGIGGGQRRSAVAPIVEVVKEQGEDREEEEVKEEKEEEEERVEEQEEGGIGCGILRSG